jgi:ppGpp synthetase/RelA/SpoT-type nucleotidyltranferase
MAPESAGTLAGSSISSVYSRGWPDSRFTGENPPRRVFCYVGYMKYKEPTAYSKSAIDRAGRYIATYEYVEDPDSFDDALDVISSWRESHAYPLKTIAYTLRKRALQIDPTAIVSQRLKRLPSVWRKLKRNQTRTMRLTSMNDMGGCRVVVQDIAALNALLEKMSVGQRKNPNRSHELEDWYDYIDKPKKDGYRGVHRIYKYQSRSATTNQWNGYRVEMQIRTKLQHAWATAVETYDVISGEHLKFAHNDTHGHAGWKRFFALTSSAFAMHEGTNPVPETPFDRDELIGELRSLCDDLGVFRFFNGISVAVNEMPTWATWKGRGKNKADQVILILDSKSWTVSIEPFAVDKAEEAAARLLDIEKEDNANILAVLVRVEDLDKLRSAYPNYYADTRVFVEALGEVTMPYDELEHTG